MDADEYLDGASQLISEWVIQTLKYVPGKVEELSKC